MKYILWSIWQTISNFLPNFYVFNYIISAPYYFYRIGRMPRRTNAENATINDFIFNRMIRNNWTVLQQACVDKEYAKLIVSGQCKSAKVAKTISVYHINNRTTVREIETWLQQYLGQRVVAKATHGSGAVLFLDRDLKDQNIEKFLSTAMNSFFKVFRETQYANLDKKIIVEENISKCEEIIDYKFYCSFGVVHYCMVDVGRFSGHKRAICTIPDFRVLPVRYGHDIPDKVEPPKRLNQLIDIASALSSNFDFVRVDLYDVEDGAYFGEFTFSPSAGAKNISDGEFAIGILQKVKKVISTQLNASIKIGAQFAQSRESRVQGFEV